MSEEVVRVHVLPSAVEEFGDQGITVLNPLVMYKLDREHLQEFHHWLTSDEEAQKIVVKAQADMAKLLTKWGDERLVAKKGRGQ